MSTTVLSFPVTGQDYTVDFEVIKGGAGEAYLKKAIGARGRFNPDRTAGMRFTLYNPDDPKTRSKANALMMKAVDLDFDIANINELTIEHKDNSNRHATLAEKARVQANYRYSKVGLYKDVFNKVIGCGKKALKKDSRGLVNPLPGVCLPADKVRVIYSLNWLVGGQKINAVCVPFLDKYRRNNFASQRTLPRFTLKEVWSQFQTGRIKHAIERIAEFKGSGEIRLVDGKPKFQVYSPDEIKKIIHLCLSMPSDEEIEEQKAYMIAAKEWEEEKKYPPITEETKKLVRKSVAKAKKKGCKSRKCLVCGWANKSNKLSQLKYHLKKHLGYGGVAHRKRKYEECFE